MSSGSQAAIGCSCGNPKAANVMHRSEGQCLATYATMGPAVSVTVVYPPTDAEIDKHLDAVLRAAGSALRHYSVQKTKDDMRLAMRAAMERRDA